MKIQLEKPAVNISNLTGGKNEKARWGLYMKNFGYICISVGFTQSFYCFIIHIQTSFLAIMMS